MTRRSRPSSALLRCSGAVRLSPCVLVSIGLVLSAARGQVVEDSILIGRWQYCMAYNPHANVVYVVGDEEFLHVVSCDSDRIVRTWDSDNPGALVYNTTDNKLYTLNGRSTDVWEFVIEGTGHTVVAALLLPEATAQVWEPATDRVYVSCGLRDLILVLDCRTDSVIDSIPLPRGTTPFALEVGPRFGKVYVRNLDGESVSIISTATNQVIRTIPLGTVPEAGYYSPVVDKYYCTGVHSIIVIDGQGDSISGQVPLPADAVALGIAGSGTAPVVAAGISAGSCGVALIDAVGDTVAGWVGTRTEPRSVAWSPQTDLFYCPRYPYLVTAITARAPHSATDVTVGDYPTLALPVASRGRVYVAHNNSAWLYFLRDTVGGVSESRAAARPSTSALRAAPDPFRVRVGLTWTGDEPMPTRLPVYSTTGAFIAEVACRGTGRALSWDGRDSSGHPVPTGIYIIIPDGRWSSAVRVTKVW